MDEVQKAMSFILGQDSKLESSTGARWGKSNNIFYGEDDDDDGWNYEADYDDAIHYEDDEPDGAMWAGR